MNIAQACISWRLLYGTLYSFLTKGPENRLEFISFLGIFFTLHLLSTFFSVLTYIFFEKKQATMCTCKTYQTCISSLAHVPSSQSSSIQNRNKQNIWDKVKRKKKKKMLGSRCSIVVGHNRQCLTAAN